MISWQQKENVLKKPPRRGPMTVKVSSYTRKDGTKVDSHKDTHLNNFFIRAVLPFFFCKIKTDYCRLTIHI